LETKKAEQDYIDYLENLTAETSLLNQDLNKQVTVLKTRLKKDSANYNQEIADLKNELKLQQQYLSQLEFDNSRLNKKLEMSENVELSSPNICSSQKISSLTSQINTKDLELDQLRLELQKLQNQNHELKLLVESQRLELEVSHQKEAHILELEQMISNRQDNSMLDLTCTQLSGFDFDGTDNLSSIMPCLVDDKLQTISQELIIKLEEELLEILTPLFASSTVSSKFLKRLIHKVFESRLSNE
jgi:hypothetical protein